MDTQDGLMLVKNLAHFVRTHEKALANATQLGRQQSLRHGSPQNATAMAESPTTNTPNHMLITSSSSVSTSSTLAAALSLSLPLPYLNFSSQTIKTSTLALTANHLFYLLSQFEDLGIPVGLMNVRLESLHAETSANYVSFLGQSRGPLGRSADSASIRSVSSIRSVMSGMTSLWSSFGLGSTTSAAKAEKQLEANHTDLKYLYSAFTKLPSLRLAPDRRARPIQGYEEFPFDTAVPLFAFKNLHALEIIDIDIRQFYGWDRLAEGLRFLTVKRAGVDDPADLLINIVLDDVDKRRRRSSKPRPASISAWAPSSSPKRSPTMPPAELVKSNSAPGSPDSNAAQVEDQREERGNSIVRSGSADLTTLAQGRPRSSSPVRPTSSRTGSVHGHIRGSHKVRRSGSGSSQSSVSDAWYAHRGSTSNLLAGSVLPSNKWRFLKHLGLSDNSITSITAESLAPLANTLHSLDLSANLFAQVPDCLASLTALRALNLSNCMIDSLHSLTRNPLPAITSLNLRGNRLVSIAGIERLYPLERLDLRENRLTDPTEIARLTGIPDIREIWVEGNPFTRTHDNYRITIFNLFRTTPGFAEDIFIEASGPSKIERRLLVDRVAERANVRVVRPPPPDYSLPGVHANKPTIVYDEPKDAVVPRLERPIPTSTTSEGYNTARRRRVAKRRIVDLSIADVSPSKSKTSTISPPKPAVVISSEPANTATTGSDSGYGVSPELSSMAPQPGGLPTEPRREPQRSSSQPNAQKVDTVMDAASIPQLPPLETIYQRTSPIKISPPDTQDWSMSGEMYRKKIEALRSEVGNGWLSVLSEESWEAPKISESPLRPSLTGVRAHSQQVIHSGRTLG